MGPYLVNSAMSPIPACFGIPQSGQDQGVLNGKVLENVQESSEYFEIHLALQLPAACSQLPY